MPITILLITDNHNPDAGGAEKYFFELKNHINNLPGYVCISLGFGNEEKSGDNFYILKENRSKILRQFWRMFFNPVKYWQLKRLIKRIKPDVIHLHNIKKYTISLLKAVQGYPTVQTIHDYSLICPTQWNLHLDKTVCSTGYTHKCLLQHKRDYNFVSFAALLFSFYRIKKLLRKTVQHFLVPSDLLKEYLQKQNFDPVSTILPFKHFPKSLRHHSQKNYFLFVGQLEKQKGVDVLIKEFALACKQDSSLVLKLVGKGSQEKILHDWVRDNSLENNIVFLGWRSDLAILYAECRALIFSSIGLEAFGLVLLEAMSYQKAIIGSNRGPTQKLIEHKKTGLLFEPFVEGSLAEAILTLNTQSHLANEYGERAFAKWQLYSSDAALMAQILSIYNLYLNVNEKNLAHIQPMC